MREIERPGKMSWSSILWIVEMIAVRRRDIEEDSSAAARVCRVDRFTQRAVIRVTDKVVMIVGRIHNERLELKSADIDGRGVVSITVNLAFEAKSALIIIQHESAGAGVFDETVVARVDCRA